MFEDGGVGIGICEYELDKNGKWESKLKIRNGIGEKIEVKIGVGTCE